MRIIYIIIGGVLLETVELKFQYTQSEYVQAERQYLIYNKTLHKYDIALAVVFLSVSAIYMPFSSFNIASVLIFGLVITITVLGCYLYFLMPILKFKQTKKYHEEYTLILSENTIHFKTPSIESEVKWNIYSMLWENHDFYYLIQAPRVYALIPKRVFRDQNEKQVFEEFAQSNLKTIVHM